MKIMYEISFACGMGADRWIYEGYRRAFLDKSHEIFALSERDDFERHVKTVKPDILMLDLNAFEKYCRIRGGMKPSSLAKVREWDGKVFGLIALGREESRERIDFVRECSPFIDIFHTLYAREVSGYYEEITGKPCYSIPPAADRQHFFPEKIDDGFKCDIAFVGSTYGAKREAFQKLFCPLLRDYDVLVYGPGWSVRDRMWRLASGFSRKFRMDSVADFVNRRRVTISQDDERKLYASAKICINIHEYYADGTCKGFSNEREFKIPASDGFQLSDYVPGMERCFEPDEEIVIARTSKEWFEKIEYYLSHEDERKRIQEKGTARALRDHTYHNRVEQVMELYRGLG